MKLLEKYYILGFSGVITLSLMACGGGGGGGGSSDVVIHNTPPVVVPPGTTTVDTEDGDSNSSDPKVNCNFALPCSWISEDAQIEITLATVGRQSNSGQLNVAYYVSANRNIVIRFSRDFASAFSNDGSEFTGYVVSLDGNQLASNNNYDDVTLLAGETTNGSTLFWQELTSSSTYLRTLQLSLVEPSGIVLHPIFNMAPTPYY